LNCRGPLRRDLKLAYCVLQNASKIASDVSPKMCKAGTVPTALHVYIPEHCKSGSIHSDHTKDDQVALRLIRQLGSGSSSCASNSEEGFISWCDDVAEVAHHKKSGRDPRLSQPSANFKIEAEPNPLLRCRGLGKYKATKTVKWPCQLPRIKNHHQHLQERKGFLKFVQF